MDAHKFRMKMLERALDVNIRQHHHNGASDLMLA